MAKTREEGLAHLLGARAAHLIVCKKYNVHFGFSGRIFYSRYNYDCEYELNLPKNLSSTEILTCRMVSACFGTILFLAYSSSGTEFRDFDDYFNQNSSMVGLNGYWEFQNTLKDAGKAKVELRLKDFFSSVYAGLISSLNRKEIFHSELETLLPVADFYDHYTMNDVILDQYITLFLPILRRSILETYDRALEILNSTEQ